ncbi:MAG TPA: hypothetical protein VD931_21685 [Baekduia sp.]|nr:hypothetical protein [Baekduia sp.]
MKHHVLGLAAVAVAGAFALPSGASASALSDARALAKLDCAQERAEDPIEFRLAYGTGHRAIVRCVRVELRKAALDCREDRLEDPAEYRAEYGGSGRAAFHRCLRDKVG